MARKHINKGDAGAGFLVAALGIAGFAESLRMPRFEDRGLDAFAAPGLTPAVLSAALAFLGLMLMLRGFAGGASAARMPLAMWVPPPPEREST